jgi:transcriptional regulator with PAS, ATPase and Fis domain
LVTVRIQAKLRTTHSGATYKEKVGLAEKVKSRPYLVKSSSSPFDSQRQKYDALIESIGEGLIVIDQNGNIE